MSFDLLSAIRAGYQGARVAVAPGTRRRALSLEDYRPSARAPKAFNVSGFSEPLVLFLLNRVIPAGIDLAPLNTANGFLMPFTSRNQDAAAGEQGFQTANIGVGATRTDDFNYDYSMHASGWLYGGFLVVVARATQTAATLTLDSVRGRVQRLRNNLLQRTLFDTGAVADGTTGTHNTGLAAKIPALEFFAVNDVLRLIVTIAVTGNATGNGNTTSVQNLGQTTGMVQPHLYFHLQPVQETGTQAHFARRV
ncbi:MAG: hypothetical protein ACREBU_07490 [Nitrososphaera sp.]